MKLLSIEYIPGVEFEALGIVKGTVVQTKNVGKDFMAGMKTLVGGEITGYTEMLNQARQILLSEISLSVNCPYDFAEAQLDQCLRKPKKRSVLNR